MAGGKQTPRQKMVNLMYLVFISMMALNMSKEVLTAFGMMNESLTEANQAAEQRNTAFMAGLAEKATEQPAKYQPLKQKAEQVSSLSSDLDNYITQLKEGARTEFEDPKAYESMDKSSYFDEKLYAGGNLTPTGQEFVNKIDEYRTSIVSIIGDDYPQIANEVQEKFSTEEVEDREGVKKDWLFYNFVGFPHIASVTKLTQIQSDIKTTENEILSAMLSGQLQSEVSMTNYQAIVVPDKTAFFSGENFRGKVVLGRVDNTLQFDKVIVNGNEVESAEAGQVVLDFPAGNVGEQEISGELQFQEGDSIVSIPINSSYAVIPKPNSAVISADKMNVVYRGVKNPMTISIPGVGSVSANAPGLSPAGGAGSYVMDVTNVKAREVNINVSGQLPGGETISDSKTFRIAEVPRPVGVIGAKDGASGPIRMSRRQLEISPISATLPDFVFDLDLNVTGFKFQIMGKPAVQVSGSKLNSSAQAALSGAKRGAVVMIFDIQANIAGNSSYKLPRVAPLTVELTD